MSSLDLNLNLKLLKMALQFKEANGMMPNVLKCGKLALLQLKADVYLARFFRPVEDGLFFNGMKVIGDDSITGYVMEIV